jgi:hypothetical protein
MQQFSQTTQPNHDLVEASLAKYLVLQHLIACPLCCQIRLVFVLHLALILTRRLIFKLHIAYGIRVALAVGTRRAVRLFVVV